MWFLANFLGNYLTGYLGTYYDKMSRDSFFLLLAVLGVASGVAIFLFSKPLKQAVGKDA
jgi:POT family proton-dependent oligopeptide transporter